MTQLRYEKGEAPLYMQIYSDLSSKIKKDYYKVGCILPGELDIMEQYSVSRITVRQALSMLESKGLVKRERGIGTTVIAAAPIQENLSCIKSFTHEMEERGLNPSSKSASITRVIADAEMAENLGCEPGEELFLIERIRLADKLPIVVFRTLVYASLPFPENDREYEGSLYALMEKHHIPLPAYAEETYRAVNADTKLAKQLGLKKMAAILLRERKSFDASGHQFGYTASYYAGERYSYSITLKGDRR